MSFEYGGDKMKERICAVLMVLALLLTGCGEQEAPPKDETGGNAETNGNHTSGGSVVTTVIDPNEMFSDRDLDGTYDVGAAAQIRLDGSAISCTSNAVKVSGTTATITDEGTYVVSGTLDDGMIIVNTDKEDKVQIVLSGANITSLTSAPVYVLQADKVFITLAPDTDNTLANGGSFTAIDDNSIDAVIFSKEDLTINGSGTLAIQSPAGHGIVSKDDLVIVGGSYQISCAAHGIDGKDSVRITQADLLIAAGKDGIHAENDEDAALGYAYIQSGSYTISAEGDGISAGNALQIDGGTFALITGGGSVNGSQSTSDNWGGMGGNPPGGMGGGRPGGMGGGPGGFGGMGDSGNGSADSSEDSTSIKGIKAGADLLVNGGSFTIDSADDAVHSNKNLTVNDGSFTIKSGDDGFHADEALTITGGTIDIAESYEGLEGLSIDISGGDITIVSSDDGLNAAGGTDQSGFGGHRGNDMFGSSSSSDSYIHISGGTIYMNASGDGIDANGTLTISGGHVTVCGPTQGDTAVLDYDISATITGGTFIGTGSYMMAQTFSDSAQGVIAVSVGNQAAGTKITLTDKDGKTVVSCEPKLSFAIVILSTPEMVKGETYTITVGSASGEFAAN